MKYIKTYGIYGLLEWHGTVKCGNTSMKISFTNGTTTAYGVSPATYITKDEMTQFVIEHSDKFKSGRIKLISQRELPDSEPKKEVKAVETSEPVAAKEAVTVKVGSKSEAIEYLKENFSEKGYTSTKLRSESSFEQACKECGVKFEING